MNQLDISAFETTVAQENLAVRGLRVYRDGALIASYQPQPEERQNQYSGTKSFTSTACAFAIQEGLFTLDDYVLDHFRQDAPEAVSENLKQMRLRHLITMSMGFESPMLMGAQRPKMTEKDWVKYVLRAPVIHKPGTVFQYNNAGPYLLGILIQRKTGQSLVDYLMPRLFTPLGIERPVCENDPLGNTFGAGGLFLTIDELHLFGQLLLQNGEWNGKQLIPAEWVKEATSKQVENGSEGYGYLFWAGPEGSFRADGKYGQFVILMRDKNAVVTVTAESRDAGALLRAVFEEIYPQL